MAYYYNSFDFGHNYGALSLSLNYFTRTEWVDANSTYNNVFQYYIAPYYSINGYSVRLQPSPTGQEFFWVVSGQMMSPIYFPMSTLKITFSIRPTNYETSEIFNINYDEGDWSWRTDVFTGSTKSTLYATYDETNIYELYVNGQYITNVSYFDFYDVYFGTNTALVSQYRDGSIHTSGYEESWTPSRWIYGVPGYDEGTVLNYIHGYFPLPRGKYHATWTNYGAQSQTISYYRNCIFGPHRIEFASNIDSYGVSTGLMHITKPRENTLCYRYVVDNPELTNAQFETLEGVSWTGLESPYFYFMNGHQMSISFPEIPNNPQNLSVVKELYSEGTFDVNPNTGSGTCSFTNNKAIPGAIGEVSVKTVTHHESPQNIYTDWKTNGVNNYNVKSTKDENGLEYKDTDGDIGFKSEKCTNEINNILKIQLVPPIAGRAYGADLFSVEEKEICDNNNWQYQDCEQISGGYVYANTDGAYVYKDFYRPRYGEEKDPDGVLRNTNYRQRHWSHLRYMKTDFKKVVTEEVEGQPVETEEPYTPPIDLIYKAFGRYCSGHTWTANFDNITQCYDLLTCNGGGQAIKDECLSVIKSEDYKLYKEHAEPDDPEGEITYLNEVPQTHIGYLPNVVGRIKIPIPKNTKIKLSSIQSVLSPDINIQPLTLTWRATENVADFGYSSDDITNWNDYHNLVVSIENEYIPYEEYARYYRILTNTFTLNSATVTLRGDYSHQVITLTNDWQSTFDISKLNGFTIDMWFTEISTGYVIRASHYITGSHSPDCQDYFRFRIKTEGQTIGVECEEARWVVGEDEYTLNEYERLKVIEGQYYAKDIPKHEVVFQCGTEFKAMEYVGEHEPGPEEEGTTNSWDTYAGRYVAVAINGARCGDIPEMIRKRPPHSQTSITENMNLKGVYNYYTSGNPDDPCNQCPVIFPRDDLGEFSFNTKTYTADSNGRYPLSTIYDGQDTKVHYLECWNTVINGEWKSVVMAIPEVDKIVSTWMTRTVAPLTVGSAVLRNGEIIDDRHVFDYITVKGDFGAMYNGATNKLLPNAPEGAVSEYSPILDTRAGTDHELPIDYIDVYGAYRDTRAPEQSSWLKGERTLLNDRKHATDILNDYRTKWRINDISRTPQIVEYNVPKYGVIDGFKYTLSYIYIKGGKILRNLAGKILRNASGKILRGDDF